MKSRIPTIVLLLYAIQHTPDATDIHAKAKSRERN